MKEEHLDIIRRIRASGAAIVQAVAGIPAERLDSAPSPGEWSVRQVLLHTLDVAVFAYGLRVRRLIAEPAPVFATFDEDVFRPAHPDQGESASDMAAMIAAEHDLVARLLNRIPDGDWLTSGSHPQFGTRTLEFFARRLAEHGEEHAAQIAAIAQNP